MVVITFKIEIGLSEDLSQRDNSKILLLIKVLPHNKFLESKNKSIKNVNICMGAHS